ncbi:hypothetical protein Pla163_26020 [Planctomycetes bacterium Pla163]|uniref:Uncharacterized protein n=1 Tax=Rohdeia mirabilis TaxID=2528008 RepID=A0A518D1W7_9BACT|nr:hypothetical protein Pla163_26020 [Planctomycetes bacterium Pla163]
MFPRLVRSLHALALFLLAPGTLFAFQSDAWDGTAHDPLGTVTVTDDLVVQQREDGTVVAFGAYRKRWTALGGPGSSVVGQAASLVVVRDGSDLVAHSAVRDATATLSLPAGAVVAYQAVGDEVALVLVQDAGATTAWAFGARTGTWVPQVLAGIVGDRAVGATVAGVGAGTSYHGFSSNSGTWSTIAGTFGGADLRARGNVLVADLRATGGPLTHVLSFSGVRACWHQSPPAVPGTQLVLHDDVACLVTEAGGVLRTVAYSAPRAQWMASAKSYAVAPTVVATRGVLGVLDVVLDGGGALVEAFGAENSAWSSPPSPLPAGTFAVGDDMLVGCDPATDRCVGFSALRAGGFVSRSKPVGVAGTFHVGAHLATVEIETGPFPGFGRTLHAFLPGARAFAPARSLSFGATLFVGDSVVHVVDGDALGLALGTRGGAWRALGTTLPNGTVGSTVAVGGALIAHQNSAGAVELFDERCDAWNPTFAQGVVHTQLAAGNTALATPNSTAGALRAYSALRGEWITELAASAPAELGQVGANVACAVDAAGTLWAFGAANDVHVRRAWPTADGAPVTGPHPFGAPASGGCVDDVLRVLVRGRASEATLLLVAPHLSCPPVTVAPIAGELWLPLATTQVLTVVCVHPVDSVLAQSFALGTLPVGVAFEAWIQGLAIDLVTFESRFMGRRAESVTLF